MHIVYIRRFASLIKGVGDIKEGVELFFCDTGITREEYLCVMSVIVRQDACAGVLINVTETEKYLWRYFENRKIVERREIKKEGWSYAELASLLVNMKK